MDKKLKKQWVKALRSKKYKQATGQLRVKEGKNDYSYCCLGVLCDITKTNWHNPFMEDGEKEPLHKFEALPPRLVKRFGLKNGAGELPNSTNSLAELNDGGKSFKEIADIIEKEL